MDMPALYAWLRRHPKLVDGVLAAALFIAGAGPAAAKNSYIGVALAAGLAMPVIFRRSEPVAAYATAVVFGGIQVLLGARPIVTDLSILILLYTLAAYSPRRVSIWGLAVCLAGSAVGIARWTTMGGRPPSVVHLAIATAEPARHTARPQMDTRREE